MEENKTNIEKDDSMEVEKEDEKESPKVDSKDKKIKNLVSLVILLAGLLVGSIFVDVVQLVRGGGFSQRVLNKTDVFSLDEKTWVAYKEPVIKVQVISDDTCEACKPDEALLALRRIVPTIMTEKVDVNSDAGKKLIEKTGVKTIPAFIFSKEIEKTDLYAQGQQFFDKKDEGYVLRSAEAGLPVGKYIEAPKAQEGDIQVGNKDSKISVIEFSDFQCPYCKKYHEEVISKMLKEYGDKINFVYKQYPLNFHAQANSAALAAACANEQGKFVAYADKLYASQDVWGKLKDASATFKTYASQTGLNAAQFGKCLDDKKYQDQITRNQEEAQNFGVNGTPSTFINDEFQNGLSTYEALKEKLDKMLAQ